MYKKKPQKYKIEATLIYMQNGDRKWTDPIWKELEPLNWLSQGLRGITYGAAREQAADVGMLFVSRNREADNS